MEANIKNIINAIIVCPYCSSDLKSDDTLFSCKKCKKTYPVKKGIVRFGNFDFNATVDSDFHLEQMYNHTLTARLFNLGKKLISSDYTPKNHIDDFINSVEKNKIIIELGSGNRRLSNDIVNVDLFPFTNVNITADIMKTPFRDGSIDYIILDTVLEHVPNPKGVIDEIYRILKKGGQIICLSPFIFPYHGYPKHYFNISRDGLEVLFQDFKDCKIEMNIGPSSALVNLISEYFAIAFSWQNKFLYTLFKGVFLLPIFLLKYLDRLWNPSGSGTRISSHLCAIATK